MGFVESIAFAIGYTVMILGGSALTAVIGFYAIERTIHYCGWTKVTARAIYEVAKKKKGGA